jgi:hypothetical protein
MLDSNRFIVDVESAGIFTGCTHETSNIIFPNDAAMADEQEHAFLFSFIKHGFILIVNFNKHLLFIFIHFYYL